MKRVLIALAFTLLAAPALALPVEVLVLQGSCGATSSTDGTTTVARDSCTLKVLPVDQEYTATLRCIRETCHPIDSDACFLMAPFARPENPSATFSECQAAIDHDGTVRFDIGLFQGEFLVVPPVELLGGGEGDGNPDDGR